MERMQLKAMAKINLGLDVIRKRADGYHEVRMIMQSIYLYDKLILTRRPGDCIVVTTNLHYLPDNENNLVYKAARVLKDACGLKQGIHIDLMKFIPVAAGLAGGSTDAAAVLFGMNRMFHLGLSMEELMELGVQIGADVPYCLVRGTALAEGIGEKLTGLTDSPDCFILIAKPGISVSTRFVYENLHLERVDRHPDINGMIEAIRSRDLYKMAEKMGNVLESVTVPAYPVIAQIKETMRCHGALGAMMSGSGPAVFGIFDNEAAAEEAKNALKQSHIAQMVYLTTLFHNSSNDFF